MMDLSKSIRIIPKAELSENRWYPKKNADEVLGSHVVAYCHKCEHQSYMNMIGTKIMNAQLCCVFVCNDCLLSSGEDIDAVVKKIG